MSLFIKRSRNLLPHFTHNGLAAILAVSLTQAAWSDEDFMKEGDKYYKVWNFELAMKCYTAELARNPNNGQAHYMLGTILMHLDHKDDAEKEFSVAASLDPNGQIGKLSRQYLHSLGSSPLATKAPTKNDSKTPIRKEAGSIGRADAGEDASAPRADGSSKRPGPEHATKDDTTLPAECQAQIERIQKKAEQHIAACKANMQERIAENGGPVVMGGVKVFDPAPLNKQIQLEHEALIKSLRQEAESEIESIKAECRAKHSEGKDPVMPAKAGAPR